MAVLKPESLHSVTQAIMHLLLNPNEYVEYERPPSVLPIKQPTENQIKAVATLQAIQENPHYPIDLPFVHTQQHKDILRSAQVEMIQHASLASTFPDID